jgi:hypothetical protein
MEFFTSELAWLFFAYAVGTGFGWYMRSSTHTQDIVESVIDSLINDGYLKTRGRGDNLEILKHTEWEN